MTTSTNADRQRTDEPVEPLSKVLGQSEEVKHLVDEAAEDLSSVSAALREEVADGGSAPGIENALDKTEITEVKVLDAAEKLSVVNLALKQEVQARHVLEFRLIAATEQAEESRSAALHDPLTGLPNRALFMDRLGHGLDQAKRHVRHLAVMFVDLDGFKKINDTHGHAAGDEVLKIIAARMSAITRDDDTVSRHGGDEFLYLLTGVQNEQDLALIAEKLVASIEMPCVFPSSNVTFNLSVSASIGIAIFPHGGASAQELIASADKAMYAAKGSQSRYIFAHLGDSERVPQAAPSDGYAGKRV